MFRNPNMAAATLVGAQADAMVGAANNQNAGSAMAFMGMNMAQQAGGMNAQNLFAMGEQQQQAQQGQGQYGAAPGGGFGMAGQQAAPAQPPAPAPAPAAGWTCASGHGGNTGRFCMDCGAPQPAADDSWTCSCGTTNKSRFCMDCGAQKPAAARQYKCDKCGWDPPDKAKPPKFCPECGDPFDV